MENQIIFFYCVADDLFKSMDLKEDSQVCMNNAEVVTISWVASWFFGGNWEKARTFLKEAGYIPRMLSRSRFCRRIHAIPEEFWQQLSFFLPEVKKEMENNKEFIIDSFPIPVCDNIRIKRRRLFQGEQYRGKCASKKRYFLGIKAHVLIMPNYCPIEWIFTPGCENDARAMHRFNFNLPEGSVIYADPGYTDYQEEDLLMEAQGIPVVCSKKIEFQEKKAGLVRIFDYPYEKKG